MRVFRAALGGRSSGGRYAIEERPQRQGFVAGRQVVCVRGAAFLAAFSAFAAGLVTAVISAAGYVVNFLLTGTSEPHWFGRVFLWMAAFLFVAIAALVTLFPAAWAGRAARISVARWWRTVQPAWSAITRPRARAPTVPPSRVRQP
jgi:hypothetical protein